MIVLIPAYEPDERLVRLVDDLRATAPGVQVLVVDDGSGPAYRALFDRVRGPGCTVLTYPGNRGKGCALKTGFAYAERHHPGQPVVCADSDGQHSVADVLRVAAALDAQPADRPATVLGARAFTGRVPARSVLGNRVTARVFHLATGVRLRDTQTGLRGYPAALLPWLRTVRGERFEYEQNLLLRAAAEGQPVEEVEIATIYLEGNASSHFRPLTDSARVLAPLLLFSLSSLSAFAIDTVALLALHAATGSLAAAVVGARVLSAGVNFAVNRGLVFGRGAGRGAGSGRRTTRRAPLGRAAVRYATLAGLLLGGSYLLLAALTGLGVGLLPAKVATEVALYLVSFQVQRRFVFAGPVTEGTRSTDRARPALRRVEGRDEHARGVSDTTFHPTR
ncbi:glycosyltransferase family 2 protein [Cellulomonas sp.]|uniref:glycosyltransferase family 2 protein n=1 Tax=Cellulomonas sp. TaxID=40001 RepID=UPI002D372493|nr:glycosyltransferase family 2 protein [Cellulomonas sp.]HYQ75623.1 glycosyltransferase family 2 protein [Cellulomonas sp.]